MNKTEALLHDSPSITSMSPNSCGTVVRSVKMSPASASSTTPAPLQKSMSPSWFSLSTIKSMSNCWTVRKVTAQREGSTAAKAPSTLLFLAFFFGDASTSGLLAWESGVCSGVASASSACCSWPCSSTPSIFVPSLRLLHVQDLVSQTGSRLHARQVDQCRNILTSLMHILRSMLLFGSIQPTEKYSLLGICCKADSKACRSSHGVPLSSNMTASDVTDSPNTKPACAT
mmetsp:Transcript_128267/g.411014  ORF Transcript_128267/g.411014 Transcript_128267/m.411014 type:complete len:229 (-) Transcript_128267:1231-1917(-)